jgi:FAD binding domain
MAVNVLPPIVAAACLETPRAACEITRPDVHLPRLSPDATLDPKVAAFVAALAQGGFRGELRTDYATRLSAAVDNSIYQVLPAAVVFPRGTDDVALAMKLIDEPRFHTVALTARGGGTGTNGQALTTGVVMDLSRHMAAIGALDLEGGSVSVQPGVVLDDLNAFLKPHGVYFAANLSPSNRATLGLIVDTLVADGRLERGAVSASTLRRLFAVRRGSRGDALGARGRHARALAPRDDCRASSTAAHAFTR